jgi:hypothetical protein
MPQSLRYPALAGALLVFALLTADPVAAAGQRSFVATNAVDNPTCSLATPCRSFGAAVAATSPGGEVIVLDSGGYGSVTIAQSVSIIAPAGIYAGISVLSGDGVTIATTATDTVVLRGLTINNQGSSGHGINISGAGVVHIENTQVSGFGPGSALNAAPSGILQLHVRDSAFLRSIFGIALNYDSPTPTQQIIGTLEHVEISHNKYDGLGMGNNVSMTLSRSLLTRNGQFGVGFTPYAGQGDHLTVDDCEISENQQGLYPGDTPGVTGLLISRSRIVGNGTGISIGANSTTRLANNVIENNGAGITILTGTVESAGNNVLRGNASNEPVLATFPTR